MLLLNFKIHSPQELFFASCPATQLDPHWLSWSNKHRAGVLRKRQRSRRKRTPRRENLKPCGFRRIFVGHCCLAHPPPELRLPKGQAGLRQCTEDRLLGWSPARLRQGAGALMRRRFTRMLLKSASLTKTWSHLQCNFCSGFVQQAITRQIHCIAFSQVHALPTPAPTVAPLTATRLGE